MGVCGERFAGRWESLPNHGTVELASVLASVDFCHFKNFHFSFNPIFSRPPDIPHPCRVGGNHPAHQADSRDCSAARVRTLVIIGIALNPAAILLICQHCNFDVIVALWLMLFMISLLRYHQTKDYTDWLCACLFLGLGILTKTVPVVLAPMLAGGFREATTRLKFLGLALLLGPVALGVSIIYVLAPADITTKVFEYRSIGGFFGFPGLFHLAGADELAGFYKVIFYILLFTVMLVSSISFWHRHFIGGRETVLFAALLLVSIPVFGPGYNSEYLYWFMPFLIATFAFFKGKWRLALTGFALIAACTYLVEYALVGSDGTFLLNILVYKMGVQHPPLWLLRPMAACESQTGQILLRLPLFVAYLVLLAVGADVLLRSIKNRSKGIGLPAATPSPTSP
ncbi:MAG: hypothetical protein WAO21_13350 [Verrucomicrobiia bacterium]